MVDSGWQSIDENGTASVGLSVFPPLDGPYFDVGVILNQLPTHGTS